jgi:hypothetical protein
MIAHAPGDFEKTRGTAMNQRRAVDHRSKARAIEAVEAL